MKLNADGIQVDDICKFGNIEIPKIKPNPPQPSTPAGEEQTPPEESSSNDEQPSTQKKEENE